MLMIYWLEADDIAEYNWDFNNINDNDFQQLIDEENEYFDCVNNTGGSSYCLEHLDGSWSEEGYQDWLQEQPIVDADNDGVDDNTGYIYDLFPASLSCRNA